MVVYQENWAISQRLTNIAIAAIEHGLLTVEIPSKDCDFPNLWYAISQLSTNIAIAAIKNCLLTVDFQIRDGRFPDPW